MRFSRLICLGLIIVSCGKSEPRRPINKKGVVTEDVSVALNKRIRAKEEFLIEKYMAKDSLLTYKDSPFGFSYAVVSLPKNKTVKEKNKNTVYTFEKTVYTLNDELIYPKEIVKSRVQKSHQIVGIKEGIKLMQEDEEIKFIFTSFVAHGFYGDGKRIGVNTPIVVKIKLLNINN
ncbi:hypothetical protein [Wenyingzhuangia sp. IMCC45574]